MIIVVEMNYILYYNDYCSRNDYVNTLQLTVKDQDSAAKCGSLNDPHMETLDGT